MNRIEPLIGLIIGIGGIVIGNLLEGGSFSSLIQLTALCIVAGGTLGATILSNRWADLQQALNFLGTVFASNEDVERAVIAREIISSAQLARCLRQSSSGQSLLTFSTILPFAVSNPQRVLRARGRYRYDRTTKENDRVSPTQRAF